MAEFEAVPENNAPDGQSYSPRQVFVMALTSPKVSTYRKLLNDPAASKKRGYAFYVVGMLLSFVLSNMMVYLVESYDKFWYEWVTALPVLCNISLGFPIGLLTFLVFTTIFNWLARELGGAGDHSNTLYIMSTWYSPLVNLYLVSSVLVSLLLGAFSTVIFLFLTLGFFIYSFILSVTSVAAVHNINRTRSIVATVPLIVTVAMVAVVFFNLAVLFAD